MSSDQEMRDFTRKLFGRRIEVAPAPVEPRSGNVVPTEGSTPGAPTDPDHDMREFSRALFGHTSSTHHIID